MKVVKEFRSSDQDKHTDYSFLVLHPQAPVRHVCMYLDAMSVMRSDKTSSELRGINKLI